MLLYAVMACVTTWSASSSFTPAPSAQTPLQRRLREAAIAGAEVRSAEATAGLLDILDSPTFRTLITELPCATLTAAELLVRWREQMRLAPLVHNLNPTQFLNASDHVLNDWEQPDGGDNTTHLVKCRIYIYIFLGGLLAWGRVQRCLKCAGYALRAPRMTHGPRLVVRAGRVLSRASITRVRRCQVTQFRAAGSDLAAADAAPILAILSCNAQPEPEPNPNDVQVEEFIETHVFPGYPPFRNLSCAPADCAQRPRYFALNQWGWADGAFAFGDVSMVLRPEYGRNLTVVLPVDTGSYRCVKSALPCGLLMGCPVCLVSPPSLLSHRPPPSPSPPMSTHMHVVTLDQHELSGGP